MIPIISGRVSVEILINSLIVFNVLCLLSSSVYIVNDIVDRNRDAQSITKKYRPIPMGDISVSKASILAAILLILTSVLSFNLNNQSRILILAYLIIQIFYIAVVKNIIYMELLFVTSGFTIRAILGGISNGIEVTLEYLVLTALISLLLITGKRYGEKINETNYNCRPVLKIYKATSLLSLIQTNLYTICFMYIFWIINNFSFNHLLSIVPFALILYRISSLILRGKGSRPEKMIFKNLKVLLPLGLVWLLLVIKTVW